MRKTDLYIVHLLSKFSLNNYSYVSANAATAHGMVSQLMETSCFKDYYITPEINQLLLLLCTMNEL